MSMARVRARTRSRCTQGAVPVSEQKNPFSSENTESQVGEQFLVLAYKATTRLNISSVHKHRWQGGFRCRVGNAPRMPRNVVADALRESRGAGFPGPRGTAQDRQTQRFGLAMEPAEFVAEIRQRLCMQECADDRWCPLCDAVMDRKVQHPRMCAARAAPWLRGSTPSWRSRDC